MSQQDNNHKPDKNNPFLPNRNGMKGNNPQKGPKFGSYWAFIIILAVMLAFQFLNPMGSSVSSITQQDFFTMLQKNHVDRYVIIDNRDIVRVWVKKDSLSAYPELQKKASSKTALTTGEPDLYFNITTRCFFIFNS